MKQAQLYVIEKRDKWTGGEWEPDIWSCRPTRAWARTTKAQADARTDPKETVKRRICIYQRVGVAR